MTTKRIVVVCGWMSAAARPVEKYANMYRGMGYETIVLLSSNADFLTDSHNVHPNAATKLLDPLVDSANVKLELIPHMLSNGGCRSWYCFENHLNTLKRPYKVPAMIFDSAPSTASFESLVDTWKGASSLPSRTEAFGMRLFLLVLGMYPFVTRTTNVFTLHWKRYFHQQSAIPKLFLYSSQDKIVNPKDVEAAIEDAKAHGAIVQVKNFGTSHHVSHYASDPQGYEFFAILNSMYANSIAEMATKRIVVLCGWMDGHLRYVSKYKTMYDQLGFDSIVLMSTQSDFLKDASRVHSDAVPSLLDVSSKVELIPHMFSNGGSRSWYCFEQHLQTAKIPYKIPAMIFDSAPYTPTKEAFLFTWNGASSMKTWKDYFDMRKFVITVGLYPVVTRTTDAFTLMWQRYFKEQANIPKLFLYSSNDKLVNPKDVEAAIQEAKAQGSMVDHVNFEKSNHVAHFPHDPERYTNAVRDFLSKHFGRHFVIDSAMTSGVVVIICGWMGGSARYVGKYGDLYRSLGYENSLVLLSRGVDFFLPESFIHQEAVKQLMQLAPNQAKLHVHIMSNGGARSWYCMEKHLRRRNYDYKVVSMVFDSAPSVPMDAWPPEPFTAQIQSKMVRKIVNGLLVMFFSVWEALSMIFGWQNPIVQNYERLIKQGSAIPKLFLYSTVDSMVNSNDVESTIKTAKELGTSVEGINFETSAHVAHYRANPIEYTNAIKVFMSKHQTTKSKL